MNRTAQAAAPTLHGRPRWRRWLVGVTPWLIFLAAVALISPMRS